MDSASDFRLSASGREGDRVSKRSTNACVRCRRQKIKCSGAQPCANCIKRRFTCEFDQRDQKVLVIKGYLDDLEQAVRASGSASQEPGEQQRPQSAQDDAMFDVGAQEPQGGHQPATYATPRSEDRGSASRRRASRSPDSGEPREPIEPASSHVENPLSLRHPEFTFSSSGNTYYLGTSSNWSFTRRVLLLANEHVNSTPLTSQTLLFDGIVYDIDWEELSSSQAEPALPTLDHAIYLINSVKFHCCQQFHLFDEEEFMEACHRFYADKEPDPAQTGGLWYLHFCLIVALGKALLSRPTRGKLPSGHEFFRYVMRKLPSMGILSRHPLTAIELLSCAALYLQCIDHRHHANLLIGDAMRIALFQGLHTGMPLTVLGDRYVERCRRIWWTVYVLDRETTSLMGLPISVQDDDIDCAMPNFGGSTQRAAALDMKVELCRILAKINKRLYGKSGSLHCKYLARAKEILEKIADVADELQAAFPLRPSESMSGISRISSHLHLLHHRCITIVTRPLLFYLLKLRFSSPDDYFSTYEPMTTVRNLVQMCMDSSQQMIAILDVLQDQGLLECFISHDLEAVFVATTNLLLGPAVDTQYVTTSPAWLRKAYAVLDDMVEHGNRIAEYRKNELLQVDSLLRYAVSGASPHFITAGVPGGDGVASTDFFDPVAAMDDIFDTGITREQIMGVADAIGDADVAWMCDTIIDQSEW